MARYTTAGYGREVCEAAGECVYTPEDSSVVIEAGSCKPTTYVSRAILAGVWVAFFQRVPAIIVRTGRVHGIHRTTFFLAGSVCMLGSMLALASARLWAVTLATLLGGLSFGMHNTLCPVIVADLFGMPHYSENAALVNMNTSACKHDRLPPPYTNGAVVAGRMPLRDDILLRLCHPHVCGIL